MEQTVSPRVHNSLYWPDLTTYGPKITREMYPTNGKQPLGCSISAKTDADRDPAYKYWIVKKILKNSNAVNILEPGDWIISINGASTTDKDKSFLDKVMFACERALTVMIRKPLEHQEFYLWDPNQVTIDIKVQVKRLPFSATFSLNIFYPDLQDNNKTYAVVDNIKLPDLDRKRLKRGDIVISINEHKLEDKTYEGLQQIVHQLNLQKQIKLTIQQRQWRQNGHLTSLAIDSPTNLDWRPLQAELKRRNPKESLGFRFVFAENQLEQPCPIIKQIAAGETPAARSPYLSPGCKIKAINRHPVKGLSFDGVKAMLQRPQTSVVLSIEEPTSLLQEENSLPSGERHTWPVQADSGCLSTSQSEAQIPLKNSFKADGLQSVDMCQKVEDASNTVSNANEFKTLHHHVRPANYDLPLPSDHHRGNNKAGIGPRSTDFHESEPLVFVSSTERRDKPTDQDLSICQTCLTMSFPDKRKQTIQHIPWRIYNQICLRMDKETSPFVNNYHVLGEKLGFVRWETSFLGSQPTDSILSEWSEIHGKEATVATLMKILSEMERNDTLQLLQSWAENCPKCYAYQQLNVRESCF